MAYPRRDVAKTCNSAAVTATSSVIVPRNLSRLSLLIKNVSGGIVYLKLQTNAASNAPDPVATATAASLALANGESFSTTDYQGAVAAIAPGAVSVTVLEI